jgi:alpha-tubulin suppressor-like RCC1 family protein
MWKALLGIALLGLFLTPASASPLMSPLTALQAAAHDDDVVLVKRKGKARPYGWGKGRKVGWRGRGLPPGQAKKRYR